MSDLSLSDSLGINELPQGSGQVSTQSLKIPWQPYSDDFYSLGGRPETGDLLYISGGIRRGFGTSRTIFRLIISMW